MKLKYYGCFIFLILTGWALTSAQPSQEEKSNPDIKMSSEDSIRVNNNDSVAILFQTYKDDQEKLKEDSCLLQLKIDSINREIVSKRDSLKKLVSEGNDTVRYRAKLCVNDACYFLQIPYTAENMEIALAALEEAKGTPIYSEYQHKVDLLKTYQQDSREVEALKKKLATMSVNEIDSLPIVKKYSLDPDTYLGKEIQQIKNPSNLPLQ